MSRLVRRYLAEMSRTRVRRVLLALAAFVVAQLPSHAVAAPRPLETALLDSRPADEMTIQRARAAGASAIRVTMNWSDIAPTRPQNPGNPDDSAYSWASVDRLARQAAAAGIHPILSLSNAPQWASVPVGNGRYVANPIEFGAFARAIATRYSGRVQGIPRIRYWQVWNEPNISLHFVPQFIDGQPFSPKHYRALVNAFANGVKEVSPDNILIAGGTAPFRDITPEVMAINPRWGPLSFMREFLCLNRNLSKKCSDPVRFDVWATHPYTSGGPTHHAVLPDDVSLGDLPEMRRVLSAGVRARNIVPGTNVRFWVTEFSWDSNPPDPRGVPIQLHTRWVAEALYRMWTNGVSLVTWFQLVDDPLTASFYQSGLYFRGATPAQDRPKPALAAFRFPFVGFPQNGGTYVWGRTPAGRPRKVIVEQTFKGGWKRLGMLRTDRYGIFQKRFKSRPLGFVRASLVGQPVRAVPFSLKRVPDRFFNPFGQETILEQPG